MTLNSTVTKVSYDGDGATVSFPVTFKFLQNSHVTAILRDANGVETTWVEGTQYTLTGAGDAGGGTLTVNTVPTDYTPLTGETLLIKRSAPETQGTTLPQGGTFSSTLVESALDHVTMLVQQHSEEIARAVLLKETSAKGGITIPDPEAAKFIRWDALAQNLENADVTRSGNIGVPVSIAQGGTNATTADGALTNLGLSAYGKSLVDDADASAARTTLGLGTIATENLDGGSMASAATVDLSTATGRYIHISGTTTITGFGSVPAGTEFILVFNGVLTLTHNATSLILPGGADISTEVGDTILMVSEGVGNWRVQRYTRAALSPDVGYILIVDEKADGTSGGTTVAGTWTARDLNTVKHDTGGNASLASNQFTLNAGSYIVRARAPFAALVAGVRLRLYNTTDSLEMILGDSKVVGGDLTTNGHRYARLSGYFALVAQKTFELQYHAEAAKPDGLGFHDRQTLGAEVYTVVELQKIG